MVHSLTPVIEVLEDKCVNCHACIAACPVKFCNDGSGDSVKLNANMCIGCGACIPACTHGARIGLDDTKEFLAALHDRVPMVAVVAPAVAVSFPDRYLNLNGWMKSMGVSAAFDVSFGAELTIKSYLEHVKQNNPKAVIAQPCPAIVTYIEMYRPELLPYLAPADSPMLHTARMVREFYPQYRNHKIVVMSPCVAKRREFDETGLGDYNVTFKNLQKYFDDNRISLDAFPEVDYDNPPAERAVLFSTPGGLLRTAMREVPGIEEKVRKIEGGHTIYRYLDELPHSIAQGKAPLIVDCLNCELGCNGGTGTNCINHAQDEVEWLVEQRSREARKRFEAESKANGEANGETVGEKPPRKKLFARWRKETDQANEEQQKQDRLHAYIDSHWKPGLYGRNYTDLTNNVSIKVPSDQVVQQIYHDELKKDCAADELNCGACGYGSCRKMAIALHNGLSQVEHCAFYKQKQVKEEEALVRQMYERETNESTSFTTKIEQLLEVVNAAAKGDLTIPVLCEGNETIDRLASGIRTMIEELDHVISRVYGSVGELHRASENVKQSVSRADESAKRNSQLADQGEESVRKSITAMERIHDSSNQISDIIQVISEIAQQTNLLALNAAIEAARAGEHGMGFAVVADEVRKLAERSNQATREIAKLIKESSERVAEGAALSGEAGEALRMILDGVRDTVACGEGLAASSEEFRNQAEQLHRAVSQFKTTESSVV